LLVHLFEQVFQRLIASMGLIQFALPQPPPFERPLKALLFKSCPLESLPRQAEI